MSERVEQKMVFMNPKDLIPYDKNVKKHPQSHINVLKALMTKYGFSTGNAIQVDRNLVIIAGHGRREAAMQLGLERVPVIVRGDLTDDEVKRWRIEENKSVGLDYDVVMMKEEIAELLEGNDDPLLGFDDKEWSVLTEDLTAGFDTETIISDLEEEMAASQRQHDETIREAKTTDVAVTDLLGFKRVPADQQRKFANFMAEVEFRAKKSGLDAFLELIDRCDLDLAMPERGSKR
ncbi:ParB N-terminal domain-containing protein [Halomonas sp. BMC6]|uniref:ParB/Srx family N-terminal domain-containing protein n=1 Tax=Halomonas sp. BMC6 TaxID=3073244 RepID=UPI0030D4B603